MAVQQPESLIVRARGRTSSVHARISPSMKDLQKLTISDYLRIFRRRIWYLVLTTVFGTAGAGVYARYLPPVYRSETTILVSGRLLPDDYVGSIVHESVADRIEFVRQQLQSRTFLAQIVKELQPAGTEGTLTSLDVVRQTTEITVLPPHIFKLAYYASDPQLAQSVTRELAEGVIHLNDEFRKQKAHAVDQLLDDQLHRAANDLSQTEQKLRQFHDQHFPGLPE